MAARQLSRDEWGRLERAYVSPLLPHLPPDSVVVGVEEHGMIPSSWSAFPVWHLEGLETSPRYARALLRGMKEALDQRGIRRVVTASDTPKVHDLILRLGGIELPGRHYTIDVERLG